MRVHRSSFGTTSINQYKLEIFVIDKLNYASNGLERLREIGAVNNKRVKIFPIDFSYELSEGVIKEIGDDVNYIVHLGAEST